MRYQLVVGLTLLLALGASPAGAQPDSNAEIRSVRQAATILLSEDDAHPISDDPDFLGPAWVARNFRIDKRSGFKYSRRLAVGEDEVVLRVKGPVLRKKRLGLAFEVRF